METHTYPDPRVSRLVNLYSIPVKFITTEDPGVMARFHSYWTPTFMIHDVDGNEHRRSYGALDPNRFLGEFSLGNALSYLHTGRFHKAVKLLDEATHYTALDPLRHNENLYWIAVANYRVSEDPQDLEDGWIALREQYPGSEWSRKCDFFFRE